MLIDDGRVAHAAHRGVEDSYRRRRQRVWREDMASASEEADGEKGGDTAQAPSLQARLEASPGALLCEDITLQGAVSFGPGVVVQPQCTFVNTHLDGSIVIGSDCIFEERCTIVNRTKGALVIGSLNLFEVGCRVDSGRVIGDGNRIGPCAVIGEDARVGSNSIISAGLKVPPGTEIHDNTAVMQRTSTVAEQASAAKAHRSHMIDYLSALRDPHSRTALINFHALLQ